MKRPGDPAKARVRRAEPPTLENENKRIIGKFLDGVEDMFAYRTRAQMQQVVDAENLAKWRARPSTQRPDVVSEVIFRQLEQSLRAPPTPTRGTRIEFKPHKK